jgi:hypothetical protein
VLELLTENLKIELIVNLNGKMLHDTPIFSSFEMMFLSELTFVLKRESFAVDEHLFDVRIMIMLTRLLIGRR